ncbi:MAG: hypothetical protein AAFQ77_03070 [Myxococcota bacterium]
MNIPQESETSDFSVVAVLVVLVFLGGFFVAEQSPHLQFVALAAAVIVPCAVFVGATLAFVAYPGWDSLFGAELISLERYGDEERVCLRVGHRFITASRRTGSASMSWRRDGPGAPITEPEQRAIEDAVEAYKLLERRDTASVSAAYAMVHEQGAAQQ